jgi:hypothetical protein
MSGFKDMVEADNRNVFINVSEFADLHTVIYDGETYEDVPLVMTGIKEQDRKQLVPDHVQGLYLVTNIMYCSVADLGGNVPEKGMKIKVSDGSYYREYYIGASVNYMGMLRVELEAIDE